MAKMVILLVRDEESSHEEFVERLRAEHVPIAEDLPGLVEYRTSVPSDPERAEYDGISELYFEDPAAMGEAFDSEVGERVQADAAEFMQVERNETLVVDEEVHVER
ncbi:EthD family reductase [Halobacteriales archaeon QS_1_68_20]|nr:MAG: EthD family reductase [Halobacteriales archaeon QS_1_68_20]